MKTTKIIIKNLFGIKEAALDGRSVELSGPKGSGKTSVGIRLSYQMKRTMIDTDKWIEQRQKMSVMESCVLQPERQSHRCSWN